MSKSTYSISDLAREFDLTTRTIRFYEEKGLLTPSRRGQTRIFSAADRVKLKLVLLGKRLGFSLEESAHIIAMYKPEEGNRQQLERMLEKIAERRAALERQQADIQLMMTELRAHEGRCRRALAECQPKAGKRGER